MRLTIIGGAFMSGPLIVALIAAMFQPHDQPKHLTRFRCFRICGAGRWRAAWWLVRGAR